MPLAEAFRLALQSISSAKLRSFFTLLGIIVSVGFLVVVVAIIQGMNSYVKDNLMASMIGTNAFQVRRTPIAPGFLDDEQIKAINLGARRPQSKLTKVVLPAPFGPISAWISRSSSSKCSGTTSRTGCSARRRWPSAARSGSRGRSSP